MLDRLLKALEIKGLKGRGIVSAVAKDTGYSTGTVSPLLAGKEELTSRFIRTVCNTYNINEEWIKTGIGEMFRESGISESAMKILINRLLPDSKQKYLENYEPNKIDESSRLIPIISMAQAGDNGYWEDAYTAGTGMEFVEYPPNVHDPKAIGFRIEGDSMWPVFKHGDKVIIDTTKPVINNDEVIVRLTNGKVMAKIYKKMNGYILLESYNSKEQEPIIVRPEDIERCYKIVCTLK